MKSDFRVPAGTEVTEEIPAVKTTPITSEEIKVENQVGQEEISVQVKEKIGADYDTPNVTDTQTAIANNDEMETEEKVQAEPVTRQESEDHYEKAMKMFPILNKIC